MSDRARVIAMALGHAQVGSAALVSLQPQSPAEQLSEACSALAQAEQTLSDLASGRGPYRDNEAARAASDLARTREALSAARSTAQHDPRRHERCVA